jgi:hypothetical protein
MNRSGGIADGRALVQSNGCGLPIRDTAQRGQAATRLFRVRREVKLFAERTVQFVVQISNAALPVGFGCEKRCRRCALPPQSKIVAGRDDSGRY